MKQSAIFNSVAGCHFVTLFSFSYDEFSAIGNSEDLKEAGIDLVHELPSVGRNLRL